MKDEILENKIRELDSWLEGWKQGRDRAREHERCSMTAKIGGARKAALY